MSIKKILGTKSNRRFSLFSLGEYKTGGILGFDMPLLSILLKEKTLTGDFLKSERFNDEPLRDGLSLIVGVDEDEQENLWDYTKPKTLDHFLSKIYFAYFKSLPHPNLVLASSLSLFDILPVYSDHYASKVLDHLRNIPGKKAAPDVKPKTVDWLRKEKDLSTRIYVCDFNRDGIYCGEPLCHSDFAWIRNGVALIYFHTGGDLITSAWIYPFVTDAYNKP